MLAGVLALALAVPLPGQVSAQEPSGAPLIFEGPGGRVPLRDWTLEKDPHNHGLRLGFQRGGFGGSTVSVPNVVEPRPYAGSAGAVNYDGSVAWYRTTFQAETAGVYALSFQSANYLAQVWLDGKSLGSHHGSYLPFEFRSAVSAGVHTVVVRVDWRNPEQQAQGRVPPHLVQLGRPRRRSDGAEDRRQRALRADAADHAPGVRPERRARARAPHRDGPQRRPGTHPHPHRDAHAVLRTDPADLPSAEPRPRADGLRHGHGRGHEPGAVVDRPPQHVHAVARSARREHLRRPRRPAPAHLARRPRVPQRRSC